MNKIIFELNEFNLRLLEENKKKYLNINKLLSQYIYKTKIKANYDSNYLEPWSQWISIHTGIEAKDHKIKHLGDSHYNENPQIWEKNEKIKLVWGCLNSSHGIRKNIKFFPDPWSINQNTNIENTKNILSFLRSAVQSRSKKNIIKIFFKSFLAFFDHIKILNFKILKIMPLLKGVSSSSELYGIFEYLNLLIFLKIHKKSKSNISIFFANTLAHYQHYYWSKKFNRKIHWSLSLIDKMLGEIYKVTSNVLIINGLSQEKSDELENWFSYIPRGGFEGFFKKFNLLFKEIIPCMSYDCLVTFNKIDEKINFIHEITKFKIIKTKNNLFVIDDYKDLKRIFLRMNYYDESDIDFEYNNSSYKFVESFEVLTKRTGRHIQRCDIISSNKILDENLIYNEDIYKILDK